MLGAFTGKLHWCSSSTGNIKVTADAGAKLACFSTAPNIRNLPQAFFCEALGTFLLVLPVFLITDASMTLPGSGGESTQVPIGLGVPGGVAGGVGCFCHRTFARRHHRLRHQSRT